MKYIRGWVGLGMTVFGVACLFFEQTKTISWFLGGFGVGMMSSGFSNEDD